MSQEGLVQGAAGSGGPPIETITGNNGLPVGPDATFNINLLGNMTMGITVVGNPALNTLTIVPSQATTTQFGVIKTATNAQAIAGTDANNAITSSSLAAKLGTQTVNGVAIGNTTGGALNWTAVGLLGEVLTSNGPGFDPTFQVSGASPRFPITKYVVGPVGDAGYQTIQSALNAANAAGGGAVWVMPGTYTENLTFYPTSQLSGAVSNSDVAGNASIVTIAGIHTPPTTGSISINAVYFSSATDIFNSAAAGTATIILENVNINCTNGYTFNLLNWTGALTKFNVQDDSTNNGVVNNTGGAIVVIQSSNSGAGTANVMTVSGPTVLKRSDVVCPMNLITGSTIFSDYGIHEANVTMSNNSTGTYNNVRFSTGTDPAFTMSSSGAVRMADCVIDSSNNPAITGAGAGTLTLANVTYLSNSNTAGTLTLSHSSLTEGGTYYSQLINIGSKNSGTTGLYANTPNRIGAWITGPNVSTGSDADGIFVDTSFEPSANVVNAASIGLFPTFNPPMGVTITTGYGLYIAAGTAGGAGATTTGYGLYVASPSFGTSNFAANIGGLIVNSGGTGTISAGIWNGTKIDVAHGGTDASSFNINGVVISNTTGTGALAALTLGDGQVVIGKTAGAPLAASLTPGTGISITPGANTITIAATGGGMTWSDQSGAFAAAVSNGYFITAAATPTLPGSPSEGDTISFIVDTASACTITGNTGQKIRVGTSLSTSAGTCASNAQGDSITLVYRSTGTTWFNLGGPEGTWTVST